MRLVGPCLAGALVVSVAACMASGSEATFAPTNASTPGSAPGRTPALPTEESLVTQSPDLPPYLTIRRVTAASAEASVALEMTLAASVPPGTPAVGVTTYRFLIDVDGDGAWDWSAALELRPGGGYVPVLADRAGGQRLEGPAFPGTANVAGAAITMSVELDALGCPPTIGVRGRAEQTRSSVTTVGESPIDGSWVSTETPC